jgi:trypsin
MKFVIAFLAFIAVVQSTPIEPRIEREDGKTPWSERGYNEWSPLITNGEPADIADFPHNLALLDLSRGGFICGASVIGSNFALSAAHCLDRGVAPALIQLRGGSTTRNSGGFIFQAQSYTNHPNYGRFTLANDISVIRTSNTIGGVNVVPIALPGNCNSACCSVCDPWEIVVTGWGRDENGALPLNLRQLTAPIHNRAHCGTQWTNIGPDVFCKAVVNGRDTCNGDSGGPLIRNNQQVGIVSFGTSVCGDGSRPSGNVRIEEPGIRNFIRTQSGI